MFMTSAVTATSGPVAPVEFLHSRAMAPISGRSGITSRDLKISESARDSGTSGRAVAAGAGDKGGKTTAASSAPDTVNSASPVNTKNSAFNFDSATRRVVMQVRDGSGAVVIQIPSEQALRQYEQALKRSQDSAAAAASAGAEPVSPQSATVAASSGSVTAGSGARYKTVV